MATTIVPEAKELDEEGWSRLESIVEGALARRPGTVRRQLRLFIRLAALLPVLRSGRGFQRLSAHERASYLERLQDSPILLIRRGLWGLRTLVYMGYYGQDDMKRRVGYRASSQGWSAEGAS